MKEPQDQKLVDEFDNLSSTGRLHLNLVKGASIKT